jgi:hypothetical protein
VSPSSTPVDIAESVSLTLEWSGLDADASYLGWVGYQRGGDTVGLTLVSIE